MPLYKTITVDQHTNVLIWKIEESYEFLSKNVVLTDHCQKRVDGMKSDLHRRGFMSVRHLLAVAGYSDHDLYYDEFGKPHLKDGKYISITHSFNFAGIIISDTPVGIDIEKQRDKIHRIAHKFVNDFENEYVANHEKVITRMLTAIWGSKESLYKLYATTGLSFKQHIFVSPFTLEYPFIYGAINYNGAIDHYDLSLLEFEGFTCVYALQATDL